MLVFWQLTFLSDFQLTLTDPAKNYCKERTETWTICPGAGSNHTSIGEMEAVPLALWLLLVTLHTLERLYLGGNEHVNIPFMEEETQIIHK